MYYTKDTMIKVVEECMKGVKVSYDKYTEESWKVKVAATPSYMPTPKRGVFYDQELKEKYNNEVRDLQRKANRAVADYMQGVSLEVAKEPTEGELRAVQMFMMLDPDTLTPADFKGRVDDMMNRYKGSVTTYETLRSHAAKHGIRDFAKHPTIAKKEAMESISRNVNQFFDKHHLIRSRDEGGPTDGEIAFSVHFLNGECGDL